MSRVNNCGNRSSDFDIAVYRSDQLGWPTLFIRLNHLSAHPSKIKVIVRASVSLEAENYLKLSE